CARCYYDYDGFDYW
nr:immunoglobulin heavy chain junction region [Mus musculus]